MSIYIFTLMVGYIFGGGDIAQGYRARMLEGVPYSVKYIFTEPPTRRDIIRYRKVGIKPVQMLSMHQYFTDNHILELNEKAKDKAEELRKSLQCTSVEWRENEIWLIKNGCIIATILLDEENKEFYYGIHYYKQAKLVRTEIYMDGISYADCYVTERVGQNACAKLVKRTYYNRNGSVAYDQIFEGEKEWYLFPNGTIYTKQQFLVTFIRRLDLKEQDVVILDRPARYDFVQPIFQFKGKARLILIMHSRHFYEKGEDPYEVYLAREYNYSFKYSKMIDTIVVSTKEQKRELIEILSEYQCNIPKIAVIPAGGIEKLRYSEMKRKPYSLISVSRIEQRKKIDWIIKSVIKAHQMNPNITIDIYGSDDGYLQYIQNVVLQNKAQSYIHFMGWMEVTELYKEYEVYISASLGETLGLSLLEAVASGTAMIGLNVRYGNHLFIQPGKNGYLVDFNTNYIEEDEKLTDAIAEKIIEIFADKKQLEEFQRNSYKIARDFASDIIEEKWKNLIEKREVE